MRMNNKHSSSNHNCKAVFPKVLYEILMDASNHGFEHIIHWNTDGRSFKIEDRTTFLKDVLVRYEIHQSKYKSFVRQLNLWGFQCIHGGKKNAERGSYFHPLFVRGAPERLQGIVRIKSRRRCRTNNNNKTADRSDAENFNDSMVVPPPVVQSSSSTDSSCTSTNLLPPLLSLDDAPTKEILDLEPLPLWTMSSSSSTFDDDDDDCGMEESSSSSFSEDSLLLEAADAVLQL